MNIEKIREFLKGNKDTIESLADISTIFQSVAALVTVAGLVFVGLEYHTQKQTNREEKAFELYQQFNANEFMEIRGELKRKVFEINYQEYSSDRDYETAINSILKDQNNKDDKDIHVKIVTITNFLEQVVTCVEKELCDEQATIALFGTEATDFFDSYYQFFNFHRNVNGNTKIGEKLETFVREYKKASRETDNKQEA